MAKRAPWRKLDNAAKIFPATSNRRDTRVFRFYCELKEEVDGASLQTALDRTLEKYPVFLSVMRRGLFWFYLEKSELPARVLEEKDPPCINLYIRDRKNLLFQVTYYKTRINFEVFHALTDGTGAIEFLRELVKNYLLVRYAEEGLPDIPLTCDDLTVQDQESDGFSKYYTRHKKDGKKARKWKACQISGARAGYGNLNITEGLVSAGCLLKKAKEYGVSVTVLLTAVFLLAIHEEMSRGRRRKSISLMVPVNLRKFFPSSSMLNFFGWIEPGYHFGREDPSLEEIIEAVRDYFKEELTAEGLSRRMGSLMGLERNPVLRLAPLPLKNMCMQLAAMLAKNDVTAIFSNLGIVAMPPEYADYLLRFGVFTSTPKLELSMCTFQDDLVLSFASSFQEKNIERNFFRILKSLGVEAAMLTDRFPEQKKPEYKGLKFFQWFSFSCVTAAVAAIMVNILFTPKLYWSVFVVGGALSMWIALAIGFYKRHNLLKNGIWQMIIISAVCILWDYLSGWHGWSVDYVLPGICLVIMISMWIITRIQKLPVEEYMIYYIMAGLFGLLPLALTAAGLVHSLYLSIICGGISFLLLVGLLIFKGRDMFNELYKKLHF